MNHLDQISTRDIAASLRSGLRDSEAHDAFGSEMVRLAFGRHETGRIQHVGTVDRGLACSCHCPACSEALIARQGNKKAWHFAHANGSSCRDALSASFAMFLAQIIQDGDEIALPDLEWTWGSSLSRRTLPAFTFESAAAGREQSSGGYEVRARAPGALKDVRIVLRAVRGKHAVTPKPGTESVLEIDLLRPMEILFSDGRSIELTEEWVRDQISHHAPRRWLYNAASDAMRGKIERERLSRHIAALRDIDTPLAGGMEMRVAERRIRSLGR
ncbi:competence protein CoiA family protein, partial [Loktanella sp. DJP18]|uniref:competence protein CoiA family protein n=1 Tax=Loktanella sp. DJP18 TaxID=3409788 RepID=UPI003BB77638